MLHGGWIRGSKTDGSQAARRQGENLLYLGKPEMRLSALGNVAGDEESHLDLQELGNGWNETG